MDRQLNLLKQRFFSTLENQTEKQLTDRLLVADKLFQNMLEGVFITDINGTIQFINPSFSRITGYGNEVVGKNPRVFQSGKHDQLFYQKMWQSIERNGKWVGEIWNRKSNGELFLQQTTITKIKDDFDEPLYYAAVITDITKPYKAQQRLKEDLLLAKEVQKSALSQPIQNDCIQIEGIYLPSALLGGDMYAWYEIDETYYGILLMDVAGHGVASSLVSMSVRSLLRGIINTYIEPRLVLQILNDHLHSLFHEKQSIQKNYYLTCIYALVNTENQHIQFASAGHPPAFLLIEDEVIELNNGTVPLGMLQTIDVETASYSYKKGSSKLIFYTDGLIENVTTPISKNIQHLKQILVKHQTDSLQMMMRNTIEEQRKMLELQTFPDDVTIVVAKL